MRGMFRSGRCPRTRNNRHNPIAAAEGMTCAIDTRKSIEDGIEQDFNSLDAQREAGEACIQSQVGEGWKCLPDRDDVGFMGGNIERPAPRRPIADIEAGKVPCVVIQKVDRLSRPLLDFAKLLEIFQRHQFAYVSITQPFHSPNAMGCLMLSDRIQRAAGVDFVLKENLATAAPFYPMVLGIMPSFCLHGTRRSPANR